MYLSLCMFIYKWNKWQQWYKGQEEGIGTILLTYHTAPWVVKYSLEVNLDELWIYIANSRAITKKVLKEI